MRRVVAAMVEYDALGTQPSRERTGTQKRAFRRLKVISDDGLDACPMRLHGM